MKRTWRYFLSPEFHRLHIAALPPPPKSVRGSGGSKMEVQGIFDSSVSQTFAIYIYISHVHVCVFSVHALGFPVQIWALVISRAALLAPEMGSRTTVTLIRINQRRTDDGWM